MPSKLLTILAALSFSVPGLGSDIFINDQQNTYDYTPGGSRTIFSNLAGGGILQMAFDTQGNLFEAARDANAIYKITPSGTLTTFATVTSPWGLAIDSAGNIYTGANGGFTLAKYSPGGVMTTVATGLNVQMLGSDASGNIYDRENGGVFYQFTTAGIKSTYATGGPIGNGMTVDAAGDIYAGDWVNFTINKYTPGSGWSTFASLPTNQLSTGLALDEFGNLYADEVVNGSSACCNQVVYKFDTNGVRSTFATGLYVPFGIAIQPAPTPEPASYAMVASAALLFALRRKRR